MIKVFRAKEDPKDLAERVRSTFKVEQEELNRVREVIEQVKLRGDKALIDYHYKFDGVKLREDEIRVKKEEIERAYSYVSEAQIKALKFIIKRVENLAKLELEGLRKDVAFDNILVKMDYRALDSVGCYVPFGKASYPSSLIMACSTARVAGVKRLVVCSPLKKEDSLLLVASDLCKVNEFYRVGGAQAIAALAYGTESIKPVDKIFGPGGKFVTLAKYLVSKDKPIDFLAGPTELLVIADEKANEKFIAWDLMAQAEHDIDTLCGLITNSESLVKKVQNELSNLIKSVERREIIQEALSKNGFIIICDSLEYIVEFANSLAPEHLHILMEGLEDKVSSAGLIALGEYTPIAACDYCIGTNHILPTLGYSKFYSGLSVLDFVKRVKIVKAEKEALKELAEPIKELALAEGLPNHYLSVLKRIEDA
ncbi:MAG: histidinol dehydrogenase [Nitrososphaerales archaeon]